MIPPAVVSISIKRNRRKPMRLWLPVFIFWPLVFAFSVLMMLLLLVIALICLPFGYAKPVILAPFLIWGLICALRGIIVDVGGTDNEILIKVW
jgi:hypothetical protein